MVWLKLAFARFVSGKNQVFPAISSKTLWAIHIFWLSDCPTILVFSTTNLSENTFYKNCSRIITLHAVISILKIS